MTFRDEAINDYFEWLCDIVGDISGSEYASFGKLLARLHNTEFVYILPRDRNRALDGIALRRRWSTVNADILEGPCSILEMMVALAIRCEETIMSNSSKGDRTTQWFWEMIRNLGLSGMTDANFDRRHVDACVKRFLNREYKPDGTGGLFRVKNPDADLRDVEIWIQLSWYLNDIGS